MTAATDARRRALAEDRQPPADGSAFYGVTVQPCRWQAYSPKSEQFHRGVTGRWQQMNEYGAWENGPAPVSWVVSPDELHAALNAYRDGKA